MPKAAELVIDAKATLGEGAIWHAQKQRLYWVDILAGHVHIYDPVTNRNRTIEVGQPVGTVVPRRSGGVIVAVRHGFASLDLESGALHVLCEVEHDLPNNRFNDGKCDPAGRLWAGTMSMHGEEPGAGSLYCLEQDHSVRRMLTGVTVSNGIVWSLDQSTMYYIDTPTLEVTAFDYDVATGSISRPRAVVRIPKDQGLPDGMTIDAEGMLWIAHWGGSQVSRWDPASGQQIQAVHVPTPLVTSCAFGGSNLDELYITTARIGLDETALREQPHAGGLFRAYPGVRGVEAVEFAG